MKTNWNYPTSVWVGEDRIKDLSEACKNLKISSPLFVTDKDLINLEMTKTIILEVKNKFSNLAIFSRPSGPEVCSSAPKLTGRPSLGQRRWRSAVPRVAVWHLKPGTRPSI